MTLSCAHNHLMSDDEFHLLRDCIYAHCGIYFDQESKYILEKRLSSRLTDLNLSSFYDYYHFIKYNRNKEHELTDIMDVLTTNETYFFRESIQLKAFSDEVIPELIKRKIARGNRTLRIWSAGCSTGEEPYTIAMLLSTMPELIGWKIEIIGTDISNKVLSQARRGVYGKSSFRATNENDLRRFFVAQDDGYKVNDSIRALVTISHLNLFDSHRLALLGKVDLVFCRNVIIYFDQAAKKRVIESFHSALYDGGFLLLGHSESLMNISTQFTLRHFKNDMIYQKPDRLSVGGGL
ncbi:MAG: protein-glutamate O-methyltransferase CheR [Desulfuromonadaceae bacterium]|nr:protein-glutamate O-methyltransferase CheR [Desulfuromonadaceae bacterium]MDD2849780.1 protein-glutamate O-methyltransferase CheR [Desulfuromonadaceae bacterium]